MLHFALIFTAIGKLNSGFVYIFWTWDLPHGASIRFAHAKLTWGPHGKVPMGPPRFFFNWGVIISQL